MLDLLFEFAQATGGHEPTGGAHHGGDKTAFYALGGLLAVWAVVIAVVGIRGHETFPATQGARNGVMAFSAVLVAAAMASAVLTA